ncbi:hypothetical protein F0562_007646 [Nyssa sinensis]|uniref:Uncharacterized protein n=1 Tax=Nyssa sinensis TaxID=561372 RepID=A0A5J5A8V9_9ASTE|nr:hypothetical protein F0562_007646 [Nyssa sinensis]
MVTIHYTVHPYSNDIQPHTLTAATVACQPAPSVEKASLYESDADANGPIFSVNEQDLSGLQKDSDHSVKVTALPIDSSPNILSSSNVEATKQAPLGQTVNVSNCSFQRADASKIIVQQNGNGAQYPDRCASHRTSNGYAPLLTDNFHYGLQQLPLKGTDIPPTTEVHPSYVSLGNVNRLPVDASACQHDLSVPPIAEAHSLPPLEAGASVVELQLTSQPAGPSNLQHNSVTITENSVRDVGQKLDQPEVLPHNSIETVSPSNSPPLGDPNIMQHLTPTDSNLMSQDDLPSSSAQLMPRNLLWTWPRKLLRT